MKLYSKGQLIKTVVAAVVVSVVVSSVILKKVYSKSESRNQNNTEVSTELDSDSQLETVQNDSKPFEIEALNLELNSTAINPINTGNAYYTQDELQNINVYDACNEAVVNINTMVTAYDWFLEPYVQDGGSGSGSIIDKRGYILTNVHVIQDASQIYVSLYDGSQYEAEVVGQDFDSDLAVLKFTPPANLQLKTISFGDSKALKVGQKVIAIGNPFGMERTMTTGIVSGLGRPIQNSNKRIIRNMIQTDAAINPGNYGGPLLDISGKMVGINTMIISSSGSSSGIGFAVPSETAVRVVADLIKYGKVQRGTIDAVLVQNNSRIARYAGLDVSSGMIVSELARGGKAEAAGLLGGKESVRYGSSIIKLGGDVILKIDDITVSTLADYYSALESKRPGETVTVVVRRNKKDVTLKIKLVES